ncbi:reactive intermediate/imine deaminase [Streptococcus cuniculi]|uniref:Reactive intermediate/imine deaminase n=1 Tax=Streptococcus cuniculi TaxID=1432788 RepID=A0A1Q8E7K4_9STRE|nr:RidA family protein [Streptococcus cuniculi]OLF47766.1 reactive intermediate/imine deaminase [Streptococcus cuniculi]
MKKQISTNQAPGAIGPYSQAIEIDNLVFLSGQLPIVTETNEFPSEDIVDQTKCSLENVKAILEEVGLGLEHVIKTTVYLADIAEFAKMNDVYASYFSAPYPARSAFEVANLPKGAKVEIEVVAVKSL